MHSPQQPAVEPGAKETFQAVRISPVSKSKAEYPIQQQYEHTYYKCSPHLKKINDECGKAISQCDALQNAHETQGFESAVFQRISLPANKRRPVKENANGKNEQRSFKDPAKHGRIACIFHPGHHKGKRI